MRKMKMIVSLVLVLLILFGMSAQAVPFNLWEYGTLLAIPATMDGGPKGNPYYLYRNYFKTELSDEEAHAGELSFKVYPWVYLKEGVGDAQELFMQNLYSPQNAHRTNSILYECFIKGADTNGTLHASMIIKANLYKENGDDKTLVAAYSAQTEPAENGWVRAYTLIPARNDYDFVIFSVGYFGSKDPEREVGEFYIDDIAAWLVPAKIKIDNVVAEGRLLDLHKLVVTGMDSKEEKKEVRAKDNIKFRVVSGDAKIEDGRYLRYNSSRSGQVTCEANLFGITTTFTVDFKGSVSVGEVTNSGGVYQVSATNNGSTAAQVQLVTCLYDGTRLSAIDIAVKEVAAGESETVRSKDMTAPFYVVNPVIQTYVLTK
ncbi:MAG: hypothetical protein E7409_04485 [Ruminococcaceae bacterium]|nr:hypothetical protein [Oscillospiraceae bacterium]